MIAKIEYVDIILWLKIVYSKIYSKNQGQFYILFSLLNWHMSLFVHSSFVRGV